MHTENANHDNGVGTTQGNLFLPSSSISCLSIFCCCLGCYIKSGQSIICNVNLLFVS